MTTIPNLTRNEARARAALVSDVSYEVFLDLTGEGDEFPSRSIIRFTAGQPGASTFLDLHAASIAEARLNGEDLPAEAFDGRRIVLERLAEHNVVEVTASCRYQRTGVGLHRFVDPTDGQTYLYSQFEPFDAHRVYACFDQPDLKAPFTLAVDAPAGWEVISNAMVAERPTQGEAGRWVFAPTLPVPTYITALVAGPFSAFHDRHGDVSLGIYCRRSLAEHLDPEEILTITRQGFDFFTDWFGYPYPFGRGDRAGAAGRKYDQLFVPEFNWGAMENAACVTFSETHVFRSRATDADRQRRASTILHELAHMWFGNLVTMRWWDDLWLNESFATYMGTRALAEATRFTNAWSTFAEGTKAWALNQDQLPTTHPVVADMVDTAAVRTNFDGITYAKGASVLKQLVAWVGDEAFRTGLADYFRRHEYGNAELADFLTALEKTSGRMLADWSSQWLQTTGVNTLRADTEVADGVYRRVTIRQSAAPAHPTLRAHRVAVGLYDHVEQDDGRRALVRRRRVELDVSGDSTVVSELGGERPGALLLVNDDDLTFAKVRLDAGSFETVVRHLGTLSEPLARALCWGVAWDVTRDAEWPARRFIDLVAEHAGAETEVAIAQTVLAQAMIAIDRYGVPDNRATARARLAASARAAVEAAAAGSDLQRVWVRTLAAAADSESDRGLVRGLLEGERVMPGLEIDTDLRWDLLGALAAAGEVDEDRVAAEASRDATDLGARRAATVRASRPNADAKAAAWEELFREGGPPLATMRAIVEGFWQAGQAGLLAPYVDRYFATVEDTWATRSPEEALLLTGGLYPSVIVDQRVADAAGALLDGGSLPAPARRQLLEGRDGTLRALRTRAADGDNG